MITDCHTSTGARHECPILPERIEYQCDDLGLPIEEVIADRGYGRGPTLCATARAEDPLLHFLARSQYGSRQYNSATPMEFLRLTGGSTSQVINVSGTKADLSSINVVTSHLSNVKTANSGGIEPED
jgi:hypothetical protein